MRKRYAAVAVLLSVFAVTEGTASGTDQPKPDPPIESTAKKTFPFTVGVGFKVSSLGIGGDLAVPVTRRSNARVAFNIFAYEQDLDEDGVTYRSSLSLRSIQAYYDVFPLGGSFRLSAGLMLYNGNSLKANASVPGDKTFDFGDGHYRSDPANPLKGRAKLTLNRFAPVFLVGWGNLVPRNAKRFTLSLDVGVAYLGSPKLLLDFTGSACDVEMRGCSDVVGEASFQENVTREQERLDDKASALRFYPVVAFGVGYRF